MGETRGGHETSLKPKRASGGVMSSANQEEVPNVESKDEGKGKEVSVDEIGWSGEKKRGRGSSKDKKLGSIEGTSVKGEDKCVTEEKVIGRVMNG
jgi:hypothetical protein